MWSSLPAECKGKFSIVLINSFQVLQVFVFFYFFTPSDMKFGSQVTFILCIFCVYVGVWYIIILKEFS